ncbi:hypothetical protein [Corynebacterium sphenisci]|uniref:hypothetical protein n=1 Tax=Corynebacterium sphenisci TaxID=191493 RepID=UPI0026E04653|nr:hypothetical protein [Corynebacterium sphenisci]MDO5730534.1 hypothetical protein [Corynebacterium sphenisci]
MRIFVARCGRVDLGGDPPPEAVVVDLPPRPGRRELGFLDDAAAEVLPVDHAPTPEEIARRKEVAHLGAPERAPQTPAEPLRVVVAGPDASLAAVVTHLMRRNLGWVEVAHVPGGATPACRNWDLGEGLDLAAALTRPVRPVPLIRDDTGAAIVGYALLTAPGVGGTSSRGGLVGEVWVDEHNLFSGTAHGVQVRPLAEAPGLVAAELPPPAEPAAPRRGLARLLRRDPAPDPDAGLADAAGAPRGMHPPLTGRAVQAGGPGFRYVRDGVAAKRPRDKVTLYRHLRDLQLVR